MTSVPRHIAFIPARKGSKGLPNKNRLLFQNGLNFIRSLDWIDEIALSSDDSVLLDIAIDSGVSCIQRPSALSGDNISIKETAVHFVSDLKIESGAIIWLFYLPIVGRQKVDFISAYRLICSSPADSWCSFIPATTHPFNCWRYDSDTHSLQQYVKNSCFRRQDLPDAWMLHHYICAFKAGALVDLNDELVGSRTHPFFMSIDQAMNFLEIDGPDDFDRWRLGEFPNG